MRPDYSSHYLIHFLLQMALRKSLPRRQTEMTKQPSHRVLQTYGETTSYSYHVKLARIEPSLLAPRRKLLRERLRTTSRPTAFSNMLTLKRFGPRGSNNIIVHFFPESKTPSSADMFGNVQIADLGVRLLELARNAFLPQNTSKCLPPLAGRTKFATEALGIVAKSQTFVIQPDHRVRHGRREREFFETQRLANHGK